MDVDARTPAAPAPARSALDFSLLDLNEDQTIEAPSGAKPFNQLLGQLGGLGPRRRGRLGLRRLGLGQPGGASAEDLKKYSDCVTAAGSDTAKAQKCADLLSP